MFGQPGRILIPELEGLRGILALWVVLGHWATTIDLSFRPLRQNLWNVQAVDVFIILSGFVISLLLVRSPQPYGTYLKRRWWRIAPVFIVTVLVAAALFPLTTAIMAQAPIGSMPEVRHGIIAETEAHFTEALLLHLGLLHGLVPLSLREYAAYAFVGQGWSVALEWQFYVLAPLFLALLRRWRDRRAQIALLLLVGGLLATGVWFGQAYLGNKLPLFALGAASCWLWLQPRLPFAYRKGRWLVGFLIVSCLVSRQDALLGPALWLCCFTALLGQRETANSVEARLLSPLRWPIVLWLGRISYPLYLVHFLVMVSGLALLRPWQQEYTSFAVGLLVYTLIFSVLAAALVSRFIEQPCMRFGARSPQHQN